MKELSNAAERGRSANGEGAGRGRPAYSGVAVVAAVMLAGLASAETVLDWQGMDFSQWKANSHVTEVSVTDDGLAATVVGVDSQFMTKFAKPLTPKPTHRIVIETRLEGYGRFQFFWVPVGEKSATALRSCGFNLNGDGQWHTYRVRPGWFGGDIDRLRFDFPRECAGGTKVEVRKIAIENSGSDQPIDADRYGYVTFRLQMPPGFHYRSISWQHPKIGPGWFGFSPATDGDEHAYAFKLRDYVNLVGGPDVGRDKRNIWSGTIPWVAFERRLTGETLPVKDVRFTEEMPDLPPDPAMTSVHPYEAIPRAGRPFPVEIVVRNYGTRPAKNIRFAFDSLPKGVKVLDEAALTPAEPLPGAEGSDTIQYKRLRMFKSQCVYRMRLTDLGVGKHTFGVTLTADGAKTRRRELTVEVKPSLGLAKASYVPEPKKIDTSPYEIGAFIFPCWGRDFCYCWHSDWSHAPWRKPVIGWYDNCEPETMDWQIKQMAENGISYVSVDWYWSRRKLSKDNQWPERFRLARWRQYLKWQVNWCNERSPYGGLSRHTLKDHEALTRYWIDNFFNDPQYRTVNGMPSVMVFLASNIKSCCEPGVKPQDYFELSRRLAREAGYKGIWFETTIGDNEDKETLDFISSCGVNAVGQYGYWGRGVKGVAVGADGSRSYHDIAATSYGHWSRVLAGLKNAAQNGSASKKMKELRSGGAPLTLPELQSEDASITLEELQRGGSPLTGKTQGEDAPPTIPIPSLSTGWDNLPWQGESGWGMTDINAADFRKICADAKRFAEETGIYTFCMGALDEWAEGEIGYPNAQHGYGFFEAIRDTFGKKPKEGWPVNCAPEDVGRSCPNRLKWE